MAVRLVVTITAASGKGAEFTKVVTDDYIVEALKNDLTQAQSWDSKRPPLLNLPITLAFLLGSLFRLTIHN